MWALVIVSSMPSVHKRRRRDCCNLCFSEGMWSSGRCMGISTIRTSQLKTDFKVVFTLSTFNCDTANESLTPDKAQRKLSVSQPFSVNGSWKCVHHWIQLGVIADAMLIFLYNMLATLQAKPKLSSLQKYINNLFVNLHIRFRYRFPLHCARILKETSLLECLIFHH